MPELIELQTSRLALLGWGDADLQDLIALCADPQVMRFFPWPLTAEQSAALLLRLKQQFAQYGFGFWALRRRADNAFLGITGLGHVGFAAEFTPAMEIAWRLLPAYWGQGYAQEAAQAALACAFGRLSLAQVVAFTAKCNLPSVALMERLAMRPDGEFDHPAVEPGHPLRRHLLYRLDRPGCQPRWCLRK